jgi:hypothetical protein
LSKFGNIKVQKKHFISMDKDLPNATIHCQINPQTNFVEKGRKVDIRQIVVPSNCSSQTIIKFLQRRKITL